MISKDRFCELCGGFDTQVPVKFYSKFDFYEAHIGIGCILELHAPQFETGCTYCDSPEADDFTYAVLMQGIEVPLCTDCFEKVTAKTEIPIEERAVARATYRKSAVQGGEPR